MPLSIVTGNLCTRQQPEAQSLTCLFLVTHEEGAGGGGGGLAKALHAGTLEGHRLITFICEALTGLLPLWGDPTPALPMLKRARRPSGRLALCLLPRARVNAEGSSRHISLVWRALGVVVITSAREMEAV